MRNLVLVLLAATVMAGAQEAPMARKVPTYQTLHGDTREDDYAWLRDKSNPEVIRYLEAENAYSDAVLKPLAGLREKLYQEMVGRIQETDLNVPVRERGYLYYSRTEAGHQYSIICRRHESMQSPEEVLLDGNQLSQGHPFWSCQHYEVTDDNHTLVWTTDFTGFRQYVLQARRLGGDTLPLRREKVTSFALAADNRTVFYTVEDAAKRPYRVYRTNLQGHPDVLVYEEKDGRFSLDVGRTRSQRYLTLSIHSLTTTETRCLDASTPTGEWRVIRPRQQDIKYDLDHRDDLFYLRINDKGPNYRLVTTPCAQPGPLTELRPLDPAVSLEEVMLFQDYLAVVERKNGLLEITATDLASGRSCHPPTPEPVYTLTTGLNPDFASHLLRYTYESLVTPDSIYDLDMATGQSTLLKRDPVLGGYDPAKYTSERIWAVARDGTRVPISLVYRTGTPHQALYLTGYGSYGVANDVSFNSNRFCLIDRGVVWALAHIRGGGDLGQAWHDGGKMMTKMNTFTDFIDCAEWLLDHHYGPRDKLVIEGRSAGGLLMGAVANLRPDLFRAVILGVPFVDVINTMLDESIPLTVEEYEEWGNPHEKAAYDYIRRYCPYTNIAARDYPAMLVKTSLNDSQVLFHEPAKYTARMRATRTDHNPLLLQVNMAGGHGGSSGRYSRLRDLAFDYAFLLWQVGLAGR